MINFAEDIYFVLQHFWFMFYTLFINDLYCNSLSSFFVYTLHHRRKVSFSDQLLDFIVLVYIFIGRMFKPFILMIFVVFWGLVGVAFLGLVSSFMFWFR